MSSGHTVSLLNGTIANLRRLEAERAIQVEALASRERTDQKTLGKEHEISRDSVSHIQWALGRLQTEAMARLQAVGIELPASREISDELQSGDAGTLFAETKRVAAKLSERALKLELYRKRRNEWLLAQTAFVVACDDADNIISHSEAYDPVKIQNAIQNATAKAKLLEETTRAFGDDPSTLAGCQNAMERLRKTTAGADIYLARRRRSQSRKKLAALVGLTVLFLATVHWVLLMNTILVVPIRVTGDVASAGSGITVLWNGRVVKAIEKLTGDEFYLRLDIHDIGDGELLFSSQSFDEVRQHLNISYGENAIGTINLTRSEGSLTFSTDLPNASVTITRKDRTVVRQNPGRELIDLPSGRYVVDVRSALASATREVLIEGGKRSEASVIVPRGGIELSGTPAGSTYTLFKGNSKLIEGLLPASLKDVSEGEYSVVFQFKDERIEKKIQVTSEGTTAISGVLPLGDLRISAPAAKGHGVFRVIRSGAVESSGSLPAFLQNLKVGEVEIAVSDGTFTLNKQINVFAAKETVADFSFEYGGASIDTTPSGASLELVLPGQTPIKAISPFSSEALLVGNYDIHFSYKGASNAEKLVVEKGSVARLEKILPIGHIKVASGVIGATHTLYAKDGHRQESIAPDIPTGVLAGDYYLETRYGEIVSRRELKVAIAKTTEINPFSETSDVRFVANLTRSLVVIRPISGPAFTLSEFSPWEIRALPYGSYSVTWKSPDGVQQVTALEVNSKKQEVRQVFKRSVHSIVAPEFAAIPNFAIFTERFSQSYEQVWKAVYEELRSNLGRNEQPYRVDSENGYMIGKRNAYTHLLFNLSDKSGWFDHAVMVTDMFDGVELQVVTEIWVLTSTPDNPSHPKFINQDWRPDFNQEKSKEFSLKFIDGVKKRLVKK